MMPFKSALNASTLFPYKLGLKECIETAAQAGYDGYELWVKELDAYREAGGSLAALKKTVSDCGIALPNAIAFFPWADADAAVREQGFEQARREMDMLAELGCAAVAAPPFGHVEGVTIAELAESFARLAALGRELGVEPYLEFWGRAVRLSTLEDALAVIGMSGVADAKVLLDPFHMYTGGSQWTAVSALQGDGIGIVHANDYPASPPRERIADADRVFPGDGIAPLGRLASELRRAGYGGYVSLELFRDGYEGLDAVEAAALGLRKLQHAFRIESLQ